MILYIIKRWTKDDPKNQITNRLQTIDYTLVFDYGSNSTSSITISYPNEIRKNIFEGDLVYIPDFKYAGIVKAYDNDTHKLTVGHILNIYQFPQALPNTVHFSDAIGSLYEQLSSIGSGSYPELKTDVVTWSMDSGMSKSDTSIYFGESTGDSGDVNIVSFWEFASKIVLNSRGTRTQVKGVRLIAESVTTKGPKGTLINMRITETRAVTKRFAYDQLEEHHRFITDLEVNDKLLTQNSVILFDKKGAKLSQWYLNMDDGSVTQARPPISQYPIYIGGYTYDPTAENAPSAASVAAGQLPVNQSDSFTFKIPLSQGYIEPEDVMANTYIELDMTERKVVTRTLKGIVSKLEITPKQMSVTVGMQKPRLKLTL